MGYEETEGGNNVSFSPRKEYEKEKDNGKRGVQAVFLGVISPKPTVDMVTKTK